MISFDFVTERVATGGAIGSDKEVAILKAAGITHVINCRDDDNDADLLIGMALEYLWNPTADDGQPKAVEWFKKSLDFAMPIFAKSPSYKLYCHCAQGINRGPSTAYCVMRALGFSQKLAWGEIVIHRPICVTGIRYKDDADAALKALGY